MAAPSYSEDLTDIDLAESGSTGWTAFNISGGGGGAPAFGADLGIQGAGAWDKPASNAERGLAVNKTPGSGTVAAGVHIYVWGIAATPGITDAYNTRGAYVIIGTSTSNFMQFTVEGNDTYGVTGRVGKCYPIDYVTTSNPSSIPYRTVNGTPGATPTYFGFGLKTTATAKGSNIGCDAVRYGTGGFITAGEAADPATFAGFNAQSDSNTNAWGILTNIGGSYELQGKFVVGQNNAGTPTAAYFDDSSGATIVIPDTVHSSTDFSELIIDHASTTFNLSGASFRALGTNNVGALIFNNASTVAALDNNTFGPIGVTTLRDAVVATGNTWKQSGQITQNGATITGGTIRESTASSALLIDTALEAADVTGVSFVDNNALAIIDSYSESNRASDISLYSGATYERTAQSFPGDNSGLDTVQFYVAKQGSPTGNVYAHIYAHSGTYGTSSVPTGAALATSDAIDVSTISTTQSLVEFTFPPSEQINLDSGTNYVVDIQYDEGGDGSNNLLVAIDNTAASHGGNGATYSPSTWTAQGSWDVPFYVNGGSSHSIELTATGTHTFTDITFSGGGGTTGSNLVASTGSNYADVYNNSGGAITINVNGGDLPSVRNAASSTTTVNQTVTLEVTVTDQSGNAVASPVVSIRAAADNNEESQGTGTAGGVYTDTGYNYGGSELPVFVRVRKSSTGSTRYINAVQPATITADGMSVSVTLTEDGIVGS